jgi:hypothetical protein
MDHFLSISMASGSPSPQIAPTKKVIRQQKERIELNWLRRNLPVIVQPVIDIQAGHAFQAIFYKFRREGQEVTCEISLVLEGEATWADFSACCKNWRPRVNPAMTYCYRTWNRFVYERTADINSIIFTGVSFTNKSAPWRSIWTADGSGHQTWAHGSKAHYPCWATICAHFTTDSPFEEWSKEGDEDSGGARWGKRDDNDGPDDDADADIDHNVHQQPYGEFHDDDDDEKGTAERRVEGAAFPTMAPSTSLSSVSLSSSSTLAALSSAASSSSSTRPLLFINTCNHMMSHADANPSLAKHHWRAYQVSLLKEEALPPW